ncbi:MAG: hypothetical protein MRJ52_01440 [Nitrosomonas sp.]|nr:hypothetical protein [Nitrosomonas sp.]
MIQQLQGDSLVMQDQEKLEEYIDDLSDLFKIRVDLFKHLATLSSGAIVVVAAFIRELPEHSSVTLLTLSLASFVLTIILAAWASFFTLGYILAAKQYAVGVQSLAHLQKVEKGLPIGIFPFVTFVVGMASLVLFALSAV